MGKIQTDKLCVGANVKICGKVREMMLDIIENRKQADDPTYICRIITYILKREADIYFQKKQKELSQSQ